MTPLPAPLDGLTVLDFSQFLAGPYCALRLQDLGAKVIKVENPNGGDLSRQLYLSDTRIEGDSTLFHAINRGKESVVLDLKSPQGRASAKALVEQADVVIQNFRPGVIERLGLGYDQLKQLKPDLVYGSVSGYGQTGIWSDLPGQDLLAQARSGVMWLSGDHGQGPVPLGLPLADLSAGSNLAQGVLAALFRRERIGAGAYVETSLLESLVDLQFEFLTTYLNNGNTPPRRLKNGSAHGYLAAPYGVFAMQGGHLALAMGDLPRLADLIGGAELQQLARVPNAGFHHRDKVHTLVTDQLKGQQLRRVEATLTEAGLWCAKVLTWDEMLKSDSFRALEMIDQTPSGHQLMRGPLRIDGRRGRAQSLGPALPQPLPVGD